MELRHRFDLHLNDEVKKFLWILATLLDPRFKKLDFFKGCEDLTSPDKRTRYAAGLRIEYNKHYKNKVFALAEASGPASHAAGSSASGTAVPRKRKRESISSSNVLASSDAQDDADDSVLTGCTGNPGAHKDEPKEYLALPQIEDDGECWSVVSGVSALVL